MRIFYDGSEHKKVLEVIDRVFDRVRDDSINVDNLTLLEKDNEWAITGPIRTLINIIDVMALGGYEFLMDSRPTFLKGMPEILTENIVMAVEYDRAYRLVLKEKMEVAVGNSKTEQLSGDKKRRSKRKPTKGSA